MGEDPGTVKAFTTTPSVVWCYRMKTCDYEQHASLPGGVNARSAWWTPVNSNERIRTLDCATHAHAGQAIVNDAGALAPVVFSGDDDFQTCEIKEIEAKENPIPPKSTLLNPLVASVSAKNACIDQFNSNRS